MTLRQMVTGLCIAALCLPPAAALPPNQPEGIHEGPGAPVKDEITSKYFFEPGGDDISGHYDIRYYRDIVSYEEREVTLHHMIRAYLSTFREEGLETWISHGTLLGWWWNGKILPWDWDLDTQVTGSTLDYMGKHYNRTFHQYASDDMTFKREYLLDVNPFIWERGRGDGNNIIDARWIDTTNGLFIDITGVSETEPDKRPGVLVCKNFHAYETASLFPMRESTFEGVKAKIPYDYDQILMEEYESKALVLTEYEGHRWDTREREWIRLDQEPLTGGDLKSDHIPRGLETNSGSNGVSNLLQSMHLA